MGTLLPRAGFGEDAHCHRCGRAEMEITNAPVQKNDVIPAVGFVKDPNAK